MDARVCGRGADVEFARRGRFLAGVSAAALACWLPSVALAGNYTASTASEFQNALALANADLDPSATITLTANVNLGGVTQTATKPITVDGRGFTLTATSFTGNSFELLGTIISISSSSIQVLSGGLLTNGGLIVAGPLAGDTAVVVSSGSTLVNNGTIRSGTGGNGAGARISAGTIINNALIEGDSSGTTPGRGAQLQTVGAGSATFTNSSTGVVRGGTRADGLSGAVAIQSAGANTHTITNFGLIEGGFGAVAIQANALNTTVVNSGTIRAGSGANAIVFSTSASANATLELQDGSQIIGNVIASAAGTNDTLRLAGSGSNSLDIGQYQNFNIFQKTGTGTWTLTGTGGGSAPWQVNQGTLLVNGTTTGGGATVATGATLGGTGNINGTVTIGTGATLAPGGAGAAPGTLTINGDLVLNPGSQLAYNLGQAGVPGGPLNDLLDVNGNLQLDGTLNVTVSAGGTFDPGVYRLINYTGTLVDNGLAAGTLPTADFFIQTGVANQINLINTAGLTLRFWDGAADPRDDGVIGGGTGTWLAASGNNNWTNRLGTPNGGFAAGDFAVFQGAGGSVLVAGLDPVIASGMQFAADNYLVQGNDITLTGPQAVIRVGDGTRTGGTYSATIASNLIGNTQLVKSDLGTLILTGINSYTGGTVVSDGTLQLGNGGTRGSIQGDIVLNGRSLFGFNRSDAMTFDGMISGTGSVEQSGTGTVTLTRTNTYSGGTVITRGTLIGSATSFGSGSITNNSVLVIDQPSDATFANAMAGAGSLTKRGAGNLNLTGTGTLSGATTVEAGKLSVNGSLDASAVTVLSGATLGGNGTVGATTIQSGATIAPGNSIGTLTVNGNLLLAPGSTFEAEIAGNGTSDRIAASGMATVTGSQIGVTALDPQTSYITGQRYTVITAAGGVTGPVAGAVSRSAFLDLTVDQRPNQVDLVIQVKGGLGTPPVTPPDPAAPPVTPPVTPPDPGTPPVTPPVGPPPAVFGTVAQTGNQFATAGALDTLPQVGGTLALYNSLLMLDAPGARAAFDALSGEIHASARTTLIEASWFMHNAMNDRLRSAFDTVGAAPMTTMSYGFSADLAPSVKGPMPTLRTERFAIWGQGFGAWGRSEAQGGVAKLTRSTGGLTVGADAALFDTLRFGLIAGYSHSEFDVKGRRSSGESDNYHLGLYGGGQFGALGLRTGASYTWHDVKARRSVNFAGFGDGLQSDYQAATAQVFGELGYRIDLGRVAFEPFAGLAYVNLHTDGFRETGGAAALSARGDDTSIGYSTLGLRGSTSLAAQGMDLTLRGALAWRHAFGDVDAAATLAFAGSNAFTVAGVPIAKNAALVEAGLDLAISRNATLGVSYTGQLAEDAQDHAFKANLAVRF